MVLRSWVEPSYFYALVLFYLIGVYSLKVYFSMFVLLLLMLKLLGFPFPSTMILISPSNFISAFTSVLIDRLLKLSTSFLYLANLSKTLFTYTSYWGINEVLGCLTDALWNYPSIRYDHTAASITIGRKSENLAFFMSHFEAISTPFGIWRTAALRSLSP